MKTKTAIFFTSLAFTLLVPSAADAGVSIIGGLTQQKQAVPAQTYQGSFIVKNKTAEPEEVRLYQTDYKFYCDGSNDYGLPGKLERSNADWVSFNPYQMIIPPNSTMTVNYTVKVPDDPNLVGTYWSMLMVEGIPKSSPISSQTEELNRPQIGITQIVRYGIQIITHIGDTGEGKLEFLETKLLRENDSRVLQVDIENIGQRWLRPSLWIELYDQNGGALGRFDGGKKRLYPGTSVRYRVDLTDVPQGEYKALVVADGGDNYIFGANYNLKFEQ